MSLEVVGTPTAAGDRPTADYQIVTPSSFETLDIPIARGRRFTERDTADGAPVCIVNEAFVRRYMQGADPVGRRVAVRAISVDPGPPVVREIVGIARQVKARADESDDLVQIYVPMAQNPWLLGHLLVRPTAGRAEALVPAVREALRRVDPDQPVMRIRTLDDVARAATARPRFRALTVVTFAAVALGLAMVGVFGVLAYAVQQRRREFGVRMALGASPASVVRLVAGGAGRMIAVGALVGLGLAVAVARSISAFLFGVGPLDPPTFVGAALVLGLTAAAAAAAPAWRASRVDPIEAIRGDG
jgi:putative ABC transport system permease protein